MENALGHPQLQRLQTGEVTSCDLNVNYLLAIGASDKTVRILEWKTGLGFIDMFYSPLNFHKYGVTSVKFSPKGTMLVSASLDGTATLIDVLTGCRIFTMVQYNTSHIKYCEFTFDCTKIITAGDDGTLCFWDLIHHCQIRNCRLHEDDYSLRGLAVSPDSEYLISVDSGNLLKLWFIGDITHNLPECCLLKKSNHDDIMRCEFSPVKNITGGDYLTFIYCFATCGANGLIYVWDAIIKRKNCEVNLELFKCDLRLLHVLKHDYDILSIRFSPEGSYIVSTGLDSLVKLWEVHRGNCLNILQGHSKYVTSASFSKDSTLLATGSIDKTLIIWDLSRNLTLDSELSISCNISCHFTNVNLIKYYTGESGTNNLKKFSVFTLLQKLTFQSIINSVRFQGNDILAVASGQKTVTIWKKQTDGFKYEKKETLSEHECSINHLSGSCCGGKIISCSADGLICWDLNMNLSYKMKTPICTKNLRTCEFSPDSRFIVSAGDDQKIYIWDAHNLEFMGVTQEYENSVTSVAFTPDGKLLISASGSDIILQELETKKFIIKINNAHDLGVLCCDFFSMVISRTECTNFYSTHSNRESNGMYLLATGGTDSLVKLWEVSGTQISSLNVLRGHGGAINCVKFSLAEPFTLASCSNDTTVRIWDLVSLLSHYNCNDLVVVQKETQHGYSRYNNDLFFKKSKRCLHVLSYHKTAVTTCCFSRDSDSLATGSLDKSVLIWKLTERSCHEPKEFDQNSIKLLESWTSADIANWFLDIGRPEIAEKVKLSQLCGKELFSIGDDSFPDLLGFTSVKELKFTLLSLTKSLGFPSDILPKVKNVPHKFLCPITHQIMKDPVICTDGYTYDRAAITEWFYSGKLFSPITRECISTKLFSYSALKINIYKFLYGND